MKKAIIVLLSILLIAAVTACGSNQDSATKLVVGATPVPHAEILEHVKQILAEKGIELEIKEFNDYNIPNKALSTGDLDANFFQHIPYLKAQEKKFGYDFSVIGKVHIEPIGIYSKKYESLEDLPDGATIIMSNSLSDEPRLLGLLQQVGLITLKEDAGETPTFDDIASNPKHLVLKHDVGAELLPRIYNNGEGDAVMINTNFALDAGLNPLEDAIAKESSDSPYANVLVARTEDKDSEAIQTLSDVLQSKEVQRWILEEYEGAIVPAKIDDLEQ